jgi:hypothetical protein
MSWQKTMLLAGVSLLLSAILTGLVAFIGDHPLAVTDAGWLGTQTPGGNTELRQEPLRFLPSSLRDARRPPPSRPRTAPRGPGDAYIALWDEIAELKGIARRPKRTHQQRSKAVRGPIPRRQLDYFRDKLISTFIAVLPYERPKLAMVQFKGDLDDGPIIDLKRLPDARLQQLKEITLILAGAGMGAEEGVADEPPSGGAAPPRGPRAPKNSKGLRKAP